MQVSQKIKTVALIEYGNSPPRYLPKGIKIRISKSYRHSRVHCIIIHDNKHMETILCVFLWMKGEGKS